MQLIDLMFAFSAIDYLLYRIATKLRFQDPARVVLCFASSWPTLVLLTRTFSNTFETLVLALCFAVLLLCDPHKRVGLRGVYHLQTLLLGALLAVGFFTRFTFVFFFFPLGLELVRSQDVLYTESASKKADHQTSIIKRVMATLFVALQGLLAFAACSAVFIVVDTVYFRPEMASDYYQQWLTALDRQTLLKKLVIAPLNNLLYNLQYENLELHGVHARVTHFAVNMPMLFGPLFFRFVINVVTGNASNGNTHMPRHRQLFAVASVLFPLACISTAPHQEPRFLLPLLIPLQIFFASGLLVKRRVIIVIWIVFNVALTVFFGVLHQGGVVPMLLSFSTANGQGMSTTALSYLMPSTCHFTGDATKLMGAIPIVFYKTYMPPRFLLAGMKASSSFQVVDLAGGSADTIATQLQQIQRQISKSPSYQVFLVAPASVSVDPIVKSSQVSVSTRVGSCGPHISTEDLALDQPFALELYLLEMAEAE